MGRRLTRTEAKLLHPVFGNTLNYRNIVCEINTGDVGGPWNSITPAGTPYFSRHLYCADFAASKPDYQWVFVHEMVHVWQWGHGIYPVISAIGIFFASLGDYQKAYGYTLKAGDGLSGFNLEQQAAIVADYWGLATGLVKPKSNGNPAATVGDYATAIAELQKSGPPVRKLDQTPF
jgi:hypothetical protein